MGRVFWTVAVLGLGYSHGDAVPFSRTHFFNFQLSQAGLEALGPQPADNPILARCNPVTLG